MSRPVGPASRLVPRPWLPAVAVVWLLATGALVALSVRYAGATGSRLDTAISRELLPQPDDRGFLLLVTELGSPGAVAAGSVALAVACAVLRRPRGVLFALVAPALSGGLAEWVLKPLVGRTKDVALSFPSGTTAGAFGLAVTACVLLATPWPRRDPTALRALVALAASATACLVGVAVVALGWHYATDALGGAATALCVTLAVATVIDLLAGRLSRRQTWQAY